MVWNNIPHDIIFYILDNIDTYRDKINFISTNKSYYHGFIDDLKKYKLIKTINNHYYETCELLDKYEYDSNSSFMDDVLEKTLLHIPTIWSNTTCGFYDMRYIFELMFRFKFSENEIKRLNTHFFTHFYGRIEECIVKGDREKTLENINEKKMLRCLSYNFKIEKNNKNPFNFQWFYLKK
jgi:hypothetical protein